MSVRSLLFAALTAPLALPAPASEAVIALGRQMAETYCQDCHAIGKTGDSPYPPAPPFRELHNRYDVGLLSEALAGGIVSSHPVMPEFELDPDQAAAIAEYLKSLETAQ